MRWSELQSRLASIARIGNVGLLIVALCAMLTGCAMRRSATEPEEVLFTGTLQELAPHHDRDHFIYRAAITGHGHALQVEHCSALDAPGEFLVDLTEDGTPVGRQHLRDDGTTVWLISEGLLQEDLIINYEPPLPSLAVPVVTTPRRARSAVTMVRGVNGKVIGHGSVDQTVTARRARASVPTAAIEVRTERVIRLPNRTKRLIATTWITLGRGEIRSEGISDGGPPIRRELLCAIIDGQRVGDKCDQITASEPEN